jgi:hypothetical protein
LLRLRKIVIFLDLVMTAMTLLSNFHSFQIKHSL